MQVSDIRAFIPSKDYEESKSFYQALGFSMEYASDELSIFECGESTFFLQKYYNEALANNLMFQLIVPNIEEAFKVISSIHGFNIKYEPIKEERWGKVIYLWGPSGELWHVTELNN
jgi:hypothetical protein